MKKRLSVAVFLFAAAISQAVAQTPVRLQFDIVKNDATVAKPQVSVAAGTEGSIAVDGMGTVRFTPTLRGSDLLVIDFSINSGGKQLHPRLGLRNEPGSISWKSDSGTDSFEVRVTWSR